ncbi:MULTISPECIES: hypothetical protein [Sphaerotilaceae]|uniref:Uncharacterized protein n=1 Tax=Aquariibacter albus TaxID=2759899 RepID=A0A839HQH1_9BURK|nr:MULTISPECIES: hypothetical protein [Burkholderiales]KQW76424.1 hypothetical protein ASC67_01835 [Methylibium sp. Root1272]MBB1161549.1 hypothetical protein [Aquariibacter albus]MBN9205937.1 hypothetical protein [Methylibium petroleiphilum]
MAHELHAVAGQSHETLTTLLVGGGAGAALLIGFVAYLVWRDRRRPRRGSPKPGGKNRLRIPRAGRAP